MGEGKEPFYIRRKTLHKKQNKISKRLKREFLPKLWTQGRYLARFIDYMYNSFEKTDLYSEFKLVILFFIFVASFILFWDVLISGIIVVVSILIYLLVCMKDIKLNLENLIRNKIEKVLPSRIRKTLLKNGFGPDDFKQYYIDKKKDIIKYENLASKNVFQLRIHATFSELLKQSKYYQETVEGIIVSYKDCSFHFDKELSFEKNSDRNNEIAKVMEVLDKISFLVLYEALMDGHNIEDMVFFTEDEAGQKFIAQNYEDFQVSLIQQKLDGRICSRLTFEITNELFVDRVDSLKIETILGCKMAENEKNTVIFEAKDDIEAIIKTRKYVEKMRDFLNEQHDVMISYIQSRKEKEMNL